ncbi:hypothetical protein HY256_06395, partial [Candidatus Sumerlaeota bacterium]|nr:hypothetical protein [Candidatus Sumerlaeota bacterium]
GFSHAVCAAEAQSPPTFSKDIAPLFQKSCQKCHRPGEVAPMSLLTYAEARPWAKGINKAVESREMPPWDADPAYGDFENDPSLTTGEIELISRWVDAGAPEGNPADLPPPLEFKTGWGIGDPELVIASPESYAIAADGPDKWVDLVLDTGLTEDKWIGAIEVHPSSRRVVHHVMVYVLQDQDSDEEWSQVVGRNSNLLAEYAAGNNPDIYPDGTGRLLKAGAKLLVQIHYHPNGTAETDRTSVGFKFHPAGSVSRRVVTRPVSNFNLRIPAGVADFVHTAEQTLKRPARIISFQPHMHFRGKAMMLEAIYPDGRTETLCAVPHYNPNWQITYRYRLPPLMPSGTRLRVTAHFDNSAANPLNPDPGATVLWGPLAVDEMMIGWVDFFFEDQEG